jgi:hypothetical protein
MGSHVSCPSHGWQVVTTDCGLASLHDFWPIRTSRMASWSRTPAISRLEFVIMPCRFDSNTTSSITSLGYWIHHITHYRVEPLLPTKPDAACSKGTSIAVSKVVERPLDKLTHMGWSAC